MCVTHKPGETMQVDWVGGTIPYYDTVTGEEYKTTYFSWQRCLVVATSMWRIAQT